MNCWYVKPENAAMLESMSYKVTDDHRQREACLYIRQSSMHQVLEHTESARRQYGLRQRAIALGWSGERIRTIDDDQGKSGAHSANRSGFRDLMARIAAGEIGLVLSLEVSRLCRNNTDWHQLLQIAAIADTLILDEAGVYDPNDGNDRLLLGLKGALSEYELQGIRARLIGGQRSKAQRGELRMRLPIGLVYTESGEIDFDPDRAIVEAIELVFTTFRRLGSAMQTLKWFRKNAIALPSRPYPMKGQVHWSVPNHSQIQRMIHNPRYAGCFAYGRTRTRKRPDGTVRYARVDMESWQVCLPDAHVGFIDWAEYRRNQETLKRNVTAFQPGAERQPAPREGRALLQSRVICGHCGHRMRVRYAAERLKRAQPARWYYYCQHNVVRHGAGTCQSLRADTIDAAVSDFIVAAVNRQNIALALAVREQVRADFEAIDRQHANRIEALRHEADLARRRFMEVDPENRLVAANLEAEWNTHLGALDQAIVEREQHSSRRERVAGGEQDERVLELANDFGKAWNAPITGNADRKRLLGLLIEDVTLTRQGYRARVELRLRGGKFWTLGSVDLPKPRATVVRRHAGDAVLVELEAMLCEGADDATVAAHLNRRGHRDSRGDAFTRRTVYSIRKRLGWRSGLERRRQRLRERGYVEATELAAQLGVCPTTVRARARRGNGIHACRLTAGKRHFAMYRMGPVDHGEVHNASPLKEESGCKLVQLPRYEQDAL